MNEAPLFGEWLPRAVHGRALRLVIEQMSEQAAGPSVAGATLVPEPVRAAQMLVSSGECGWPWRGEAGDPAPSLTWSVPWEVEFRSLRLEQTSETEWIRRYRIEVSPDGESWEVAVPSRLIDSYHRQPCRLRSRVECLESSLLPAGQGTHWARTFFEDFMLKTIEPIGPGRPYSEWLSGEYFLAAAVRPFGFGGVYNSGDAGNFNALIAALLCPEMAVEGQRLFPDLIGHFGFMPGVMNPVGVGDTVFALDYTGTTWGPCCYYDLAPWIADREFLGWFADSCATWGRWWLANRDRNGDGWLEPGVNECAPSTPEFREQNRLARPQLAAACPEFWDYVSPNWPQVSSFQQATYEEPWDDGHMPVRGRHRGMKFDPETCSINVHFIETQCYISLLLGFVDSAYRGLGRAEEGRWFAAEARRLAGLVAENCWDEATGFYYDRDGETGALRTFVKHVGAFVPMLMGLPTVEQARRMVEHLTNPQEFWTEYPVPVISLDSPDYSPEGYWSGRAWPPTNFFVLRALLNYGYLEVADDLLRRWVAQTEGCIDRPLQNLTDFEWREGPCDMRRAHVADVEWIVAENWSPETGAVHGSGGLVWGGLWLPAVIMRHFWPVGDGEVLLRPGGSLRLDWGERWRVRVDGDRAEVNGRGYHLPEATTYLLDECSGRLEPLAPGQADPVVLARR